MDWKLRQKYKMINSDEEKKNNSKTLNSKENIVMENK